MLWRRPRPRRRHCAHPSAPAAATTASWCPSRATPGTAAGSCACARSARSSASGRRSWQPRRRLGSRRRSRRPGQARSPFRRARAVGQQPGRALPPSPAATRGRREPSPTAAARARHAGGLRHLPSGTTVRTCPLSIFPASSSVLFPLSNVPLAHFADCSAPAAQGPTPAVCVAVLPRSAPGFHVGPCAVRGGNNVLGLTATCGLEA